MTAVVSDHRVLSSSNHDVANRLDAASDRALLEQLSFASARAPLSPEVAAAGAALALV